MLEIIKEETISNNISCARCNSLVNQGVYRYTFSDDTIQDEQYGGECQCCGWSNKIEEEEDI